MAFSSTRSCLSVNVGARYAALSQSQGGVLKVSFLRNFFRGCGLLKDPIIRAKLDVMLQQYPVKRHGAFTPSRNSRRGSSHRTTTKSGFPEVFCHPVALNMLPHRRRRHRRRCCCCCPARKSERKCRFCQWCRWEWPDSRGILRHSPRVRAQVFSWRIPTASFTHICFKAWAEPFVALRG